MKSAARVRKQAKVGSEGHVAASRQPHGHAEHVLLRDISLEETAGRLRLKLLGVSGILDVAIQRHDARVGLGQGGQAVAKASARGDRLAAELVRGLGEELPVRRRRRLSPRRAAPTAGAAANHSRRP